ncbi:mechanosensitive ion channel family protein [Sulfolobus sp. S-194]|uniref:mechanosensitive ion channel family protein n=1 Tax=Sulfolobus sp. S-194 TaxID=2512240 RepID=UPI001436DE59|nr:mechanosensitive ion channel family protein [Sulfolobus sp. S-194]QIW23701.1 mechanosensitive ion channel family protein [Sulfolobus sp. S-194]
MNRLVTLFIILFVVIGVAVGTTVILSAVLHIPVTITSVINAILIGVVGVISINIISRIIKLRAGNVVGKTTAESLSLVIQFIGYTIIVILALTAVHVAVTSALIGGTVFGLVIGLALQTPLSNVFSGIFLILSRPFNIGDRVTLTTWQYGLLAPTYPPKFWSNDFLIPGYTGIIQDINLMYTTILTDENVVMKIPNNIMIQAAIFVHNEEYRLVRTKYEIPKDLDPDYVIPKLKEKISGLSFLVKEPEIKVLDTTLNTYVIVVDAYCKGQYEEPPRSEIIKVIMKTIKDIQSVKVNEKNSSH